MCVQIVLTVSQMMWCRDVSGILSSKSEDESASSVMQDFEQKSFQVCDRYSSSPLFTSRVSAVCQMISEDLDDEVILHLCSCRTGRMYNY